MSTRSNDSGSAPDIESGGGTSPMRLSLADMPSIGTINNRFQSYNVEMVEVIGGRFWRPYRASSDPTRSAPPSPDPSAQTPVGMDPALYESRPPINLTNSRLRKLAAALGPAYVRVSGTWANSVYFHGANSPAPSTPPEGFGGVLTRQQWEGVIDFADAVDAKPVISFATGAGTRDAAGVWTPAQAHDLLAYTASIGGSIAAAEFMNEPTYAAMGGAPADYDAVAYGRDVAVFTQFIRQAAPDLIFLGPGSVGEGGVFPIALGSGMLATEELLKVVGPVFDAFSFHVYGAASQRCASLGMATQTTADAALSDEWLSRAGAVEAFYADLRDQFLPGKPLWVTETADAACGGNPWASTFLDTFRYLVQHGSFARRGVQVIAHNTLASSDYGLLDEETLAPRPNYWAALLWRKLMGTTVLDANPTPAPHLYLFAHSLRGKPGGVALLVINTDRDASQAIELVTPAERYTLSARNLLDTRIQLNGNDLTLASDNILPEIVSAPVSAGRLTLAPASITFLAIPDANNRNCR
ncbi:MAG TPA: hypothetical protein VFL82_06110 [Thermomicrobiales bacterium]|nr:hypothetical protein [Thermomicrobiales bacterium]